MPTVMVIYVLATYALVTFVHISNISAVTGPILTKLFGPNLLGVIIFVDQNVFGFNLFWPRFVGPQCFLGQKFLTSNFIEPKKKLNSKFFWTQNFSDPKFFLGQIFFLEIILGQKFLLDPNFCFKHFFLDPKFIWAQKIFGPTFSLV